MVIIDEGLALEIITNPTDLQFLLVQREDDGNYCFIIIRGPKDGFRMLFRAPDFVKTKEEIIQRVETLLESFRSVTHEILGDEDGVFTECINPETMECRELKLMDQVAINRILDALRQNGIAPTFLM